MSLAQEFDQIGRKKTHRGRRSRGKGAKPHMETAKEHIALASKESDPHKAHAHLFRAISSINKAKKEAPQEETEIAA